MVNLLKVVGSIRKRRALDDLGLESKNIELLRLTCFAIPSTMLTLKIHPEIWHKHDSQIYLMICDWIIGHQVADWGEDSEGNPSKLSKDWMESGTVVWDMVTWDGLREASSRQPMVGTTPEADFWAPGRTEMWNLQWFDIVGCKGGEIALLFASFLSLAISEGWVRKCSYHDHRAWNTHTHKDM